MRITVIGAGYVGLVAAACLANLGNEVTLVDIDENRLKQISRGYHRSMSLGWTKC